MFQKYRVEIITFVVAALAALGLFAALELRKPNGGLLAYFRVEPVVRHKETGEVLARGASKRDAVLEYVAHVREMRERFFRGSSSEPSPETSPASSPPAPSTERSQNFGRRRGRLAGADVSDVDFSGADLAGLRLRDALCHGADFKGADLSEARFEGSQFLEANFEGARLSMASLEGADCSRANLRGIEARGTRFRGTNLTAADLSSADLSQADLSGANLAGVVFDQATRFDGAQLAGALNVSVALRNHAEKMGASFTADAKGEDTP